MLIKDCDLGLIVYDKRSGGYDESGVITSVKVGHIVGVTIYNNKLMPVVKWAKPWPSEGNTAPIDPWEIEPLKFRE